MKTFFLVIILGFSFISFIIDVNANYGPFTCTYGSPTTTNGLAVYPNFTCGGDNLGSMTNFQINSTSPLTEVSTEDRYLGSCRFTAHNLITRTITNFTCPGAVTIWSSATGATGATGTAGPQGNDGNNAYELAQIIEGYTGTVYEWLDDIRGATGATGSVSFSVDLNQTGSIQVVNNVSLNNSSATLSTGSLQLPIFTEVNGVTYLDWTGVRNSIMLIVLFVGLFWLALPVITKKDRL